MTLNRAVRGQDPGRRAQRGPFAPSYRSYLITQLVQPTCFSHSSWAGRKSWGNPGSSWELPSCLWVRIWPLGVLEACGHHSRWLLHLVPPSPRSADRFFRAPNINSTDAHILPHPLLTCAGRRGALMGCQVETCGPSTPHSTGTGLGVAEFCKTSWLITREA